jgi:hypothetical protein
MKPMRNVRDRLRSLGRPPTLPSLYDLHPHAIAAARRDLGLQIVPVDEIVGTTRHPSQNTADFLPLPQLRGQNWRARWQRLCRAVDRLEVLPPVDLLKVGDKYYVTDGHNRVAAARRAGMVGIDADVTELLLPGMATAPPPQHVTTSLIDGGALREAAAGRLSRTAERSSASDRLGREQLLSADAEADPDADSADPE